MKPKVKDIMTPRVITIPKGSTILQAAGLMKDKGVGSLLVKEGDNPVGIVTERDFIYKVVLERIDTASPVDKIMAAPVITVAQEMPVEEAARLMKKKNIRRLVVMEGDRMIGIVTSTDISRTSPEYTSELSKTIGKLEDILRDL
jgi:CBS domain-containing protein